MISLHITTSLIALLLAGGILFMLGKGKLRTGHSLWWLGLALVILLLGVFPSLADRLGHFLGVHYPPVLLLVLALGLVLVKILSMDLERADQEKRIRILAQRLAVLERNDPPGSEDSPSGPE